MGKAQLFLNGARVNRDFRDALFDAANRDGVSLNEFVIRAAAEKLSSHGVRFAGVFQEGDCEVAA